MKLLAMAINTFREAIRNKILYTLIFFAVAFTGFSVLMSTGALGGNLMVIISMGLANIEIFCTMIAIFVGISLVYKEIERRTIYVILSRPVPRYQIILGKYLGLLFTLALELAIMTAFFFAAVSFFDTGIERLPGLSVAVLLIAVKVMLITAVAVCFSSFSTPILSGLFTLAFYLIASISGYLDQLLPPNAGPFTQSALRSLQFILPDFRFMDIKADVIYQNALDVDRIVGSSVYGLLYCALVLLLAIVIFDRKDVK